MTGFYDQCRQHIKDLIYLEGGGESARTDSAVRQALALYSRAEMPFTYEPGLTANAIEYVGIYVFLLVLICTFILVPVFASDCQTRADQILRCARDGRGRLAVSRILAGLLLAGVLYVVCMALFLLLLNASFGFRGLDTSLQLLVSVSVFLPLTVGQMELLIGAAGFLSLLATAGLHPLPVGKNEDSGLSQHRCLRLSHPAHGGVHDPWWKYRELGPLPAALRRRGAHEQLHLRGHGHRLCLSGKRGHLAPVPDAGSGGSGVHPLCGAGGSELVPEGRVEVTPDISPV